MIKEERTENDEVWRGSDQVHICMGSNGEHIWSQRKKLKVGHEKQNRYEYTKQSSNLVFEG